MSSEHKKEILIAEHRKKAWKETRKLWKAGAIAVVLTLIGLVAAYHYLKIEIAAVVFGLAILILGFLFPEIPIVEHYLPRFLHRLGLGLSMSVLIMAACYPIYDSERGKQHSALTIGFLIPMSAGTATKLIIEVGDAGYTIDMSKASEAAEIRFLQDEHLRLEVENGVPLVSTIIRDRDDKVLVKVEKNHWEVSGPPLTMDKNYTQDTLEVKDARDRVVFYVRILPDRAQIEGEWRDDTGFGVRMSAPEPGMVRQGGMGLSFLRPRSVDPQGIGDAVGRIQPKFLYPSAEHWGELATKRN